MLEPVKIGWTRSGCRRDDRGRRRAGRVDRPGPWARPGRGAAKLVHDLLERSISPPSSTLMRSSASSPVARGAARCSRHMRASSHACSTRTPPGWERTGWRLLGRRPAAFARRLLKAPDTIVAAPAGGASCAVSARPRSRRQAPATCSPGSSAAFLAKGVEPHRPAAAAAAVAHAHAASSSRTAPGSSPETCSTPFRRRSSPDRTGFAENAAWSARASRSTSARSGGMPQTLMRAAGGAELWAVVKAEGYGHGAVDVSRAALEGGAAALCVATVPRRSTSAPRCGRRGSSSWARSSEQEVAGGAGGARLELVPRTGACPRGSRPPEARHGHGAVGPLRAAGADAGRRRGHEPSRVGRERSRLQPQCRSSDFARRPTGSGS